MKKTVKKFQKQLRRARRYWQLGRLTAEAVKVLGYSVCALVAYGMLDYYLAFDSAHRYVLGIALMAIFAVLAIWRVWCALARSPRDTAVFVDRLSGNRRRETLSALELSATLASRQAGDSQDLPVYLLAQSVTRGTECISRAKRRELFELKNLWGKTRIGGLQLALGAVIALSQFSATQTILQRIFYPNRDIPPCSPYVFNLQSEDLEVIYGGTLEVGVEITGNAVNSPVVMDTRHGAEAVQAPCFRESSARFTQRIENVTRPLELCFRTGRARSKWYKVKVRYQPRITTAQITIQPPSYSGLPIRSFQAGEDPIKALRRAELSLLVTSNRPLRDGVLTMRPQANPEEARKIHGTKTGAKSVAFDWELGGPAQLAVTVRDVRGTASAEPLVLQQTELTDEPPEVYMTEPAGMMLATATSQLTVRGTAEDDLGLTAVGMMRGLCGYRDRLKSIGPDAVTRSVRVEQQFDLAQLGVVPGQVLEFYLEGRDTNPDMTGYAAADIARVHIISQEKYAQILRNRNTLEDFVGRYQAAAVSVQKVKQVLDELRQAVAEGREAEAVERLLKKALEVNQNALEVNQKIAEDFQLYDMEKKLKNTASELEKLLISNRQQLRALNAGMPDLRHKVAEMLEKLGGPTQSLRQQMGAAKILAQLGRLSALARQIKDIMRRQENLARRLERFGKTPPAADLQLLAILGREQDDIRRALAELRDQLREHADDLPEEYAELADGARTFADAIDRYHILPLMSEGVTAAENEEERKTYLRAESALGQLKDLLEPGGDGGFGGMCNGEMPFTVPGDLKKTMRQLMDSLGRGFGDGDLPGTGSGSGPGITYGGGLDSGTWMGGHSLLNIPVAGPPRHSFSKIPVDRMGGGKGFGRQNSGDSPGRGVTPAEETLQINETRQPEAQGLPLQDVPARYRDAVKRYFSE